MQHAFESLERRAMFSVSMDAAGWTVVTPASDTRIIHVSSSSGNDSNDGLDPSRPVRTIDKARSLVRDNSADWMLLRRGDTFGSLGEWKKSGRSQQEPIYISAYGSGARPQINSGTGTGFFTYANGSRRINNVILSSISFFADTYNHSNGNGATAGIRLTCPGDGILIEDVLVRGYKDNVVFDAVSASLTNVTLRRSVIVDAHAGSGVGNGHSQGVYVGPNQGNITIEQNVFDHNGWRPGVSSDRTYYNHNIYTQTGSHAVIRGNIVSRAAFYGVKLNGTGTVEGNLFIRNSESVYLESAATVQKNVITEAVDMPAAGWGVGINTQKSPQATIRDNLVTKLLSAGAAGVAGVQLFNNGTPFRGTVESNVVYNWRNGLLNMTPGAGTGSVTIRNNELQMTASDTAAGDHRSGSAQSTFVYSGNKYAAGTRTSSANRVSGSFQSLSQWVAKTGESGASYQQISYPDPSRDIPRYAASVNAGSTTESFISAARGMARTSYNPAITASAASSWIWQGFGRNVGAPIPATVKVVSSDVQLAGDQPAVRITFDADVSGSVAPSDLLVRNDSIGQVVGVQAATFHAPSRTATFALPAALPDGHYTATLRAGSVQAPSGALLVADHAAGFTFLAGDANFDQRVDVSDFSALATNFNRAATFAQGDFDYSGTAGLPDFAVLASRFNLGLSDVIAASATTAAGGPLLPAAPAVVVFSIEPIAALIE